MKFVDSVIDVEKLFFGNVIQDVSFSIKRGDYTAIIGPNGGGKSTLLKLMLGLLRHTSGSIKLFNKEQKRFKEYHKIGYVPQRASQSDIGFPITVEEVARLGIAYKSSIFCMESKDDVEYIKHVMDKMGVSELANRRISELSGGQRQRVMIARALVSKPQILILDEPNTGVDVVSQRKFYDLLRKLNEDENITVVFVTHDLGVIADDVKNVLCVNQKLLACHNPHEILSCSKMSKLYGIDSHVVCHHH